MHLVIIEVVELVKFCCSRLCEEYAGCWR